MTETVKASLDKLGKQREPGEPLPALPAASSISAATGYAKPQSPAAAPNSGGGIASPLTETTYEAREYHAEETLFTSDGLFSWTRKRVKSVSMQDANGAAVQLRLKAPAS